MDELSIAAKIKQTREAAGFTQAQLAEKIGTTSQNISQYERGLRKPKYETMLKISTALAEALNIDPEELLKTRWESTNERHEKGIISQLLELKPPANQIIQTEQELKVQLAFRKLNDNGQQIAIERIEELAQIPKYQRTTSSADTITPPGDSGTEK